MIFFGDPESRGSADDAVAYAEMAPAMREGVTALCATWVGRGIQQPLHVRLASTPVTAPSATSVRRNISITPSSAVG
jgi:hypothetical protein